MTDAALLQFRHGLHLRDVQRMEEARGAIAEAATLAPDDARIALGNAHVHFETWRGSTALFERALALAPGEAGPIAGLAGSLDADGRVDEAEALLERALADWPGWVAGHQQLARLRIVAGRAEGFDRNFATACAMAPSDPALRLAWFHALVGVRDWAAARHVIADGAIHIGPQRGFDLASVFLASESDEASRDPRMFDQVAGVADVGLELCRVRFWLRNGRPDLAASFAAAQADAAAARHFWPYLSLAWRMLGDARSAWLDADAESIRTFDIGLSPAELIELAGTLRGLLTKRAAPPEQSVRGGIQTDRNLFFHPAPAIQALRHRAAENVRSYVDALPPPDARHPLLAPDRERLLFDGSWTVLLNGAGYHAPHTHSRGWISSALHVELPDVTIDDKADAGWLAFGTPPSELNIDLGSTRVIEPRPGKLVLFPSTTWHQTLPFESGERLTVAFDLRALTSMRPG